MKHPQIAKTKFLGKVLTKLQSKVSRAKTQQTYQNKGTNETADQVTDQVNEKKESDLAIGDFATDTNGNYNNNDTIKKYFQTNNESIKFLTHDLLNNGAFGMVHKGSYNYKTTLNIVMY